MKLHICFDLGGDTLKVGFAFQKDGELVTGKLMNNHFSHSAFPAYAYYDEKSRIWYYGDVVDRVAVNNFRTVVKIKTLLNLLRKRDSSSNPIEKSVRQKNQDYYYNQYFFPAFHFPEILKDINDYGKFLSAIGNSFISQSTPQKVCEGFFEYIKIAIDKKIELLEKIYNVTFSGTEYMLIYPLGSGYYYEEEFKRIINKVFKTSANNKYNSIKVLCKYLDYIGDLKVNDNVLVFDMGEDRVSVAKACINAVSAEKSFYIENADGHSSPLNIGGRDIDQVISAGILNNISKRETVGTDSYGEDNHIVENGLISKQYSFMNDIKYAKKTLSDTAFKDYPLALSVSRDLDIQKDMTRKNILDSIGISSNTGLARQICEYVLTELKRKNNYDVNKVYFAGGLIETYGLEKYISDAIHSQYSNISVNSIKAIKVNEKRFAIKENEDSVYAAAIAGAITSLYDFKIDTRLSKSFGTYYDRETAYNQGFEGKKIRYYYIIADRGTLLDCNAEIDGDRCTKLPAKTKFKVGKSNNDFSEQTSEEIYSSKYGTFDFSTKRFKTIKVLKIDGNDVPVIGAYRNDILRRIDCSEIDLDSAKPVIKNQIIYCYNGKRVKIRGRINARQGFIIVDDGVVKPYIETDCEACGDTKVDVETMPEPGKFSERKTYNGIFARDVEIKYFSDFSFSIK